MMFKRKGKISDLNEIYLLEKMIFKDEAWTPKMLKIELLNNRNSKTLIVEEDGEILGYIISRRFLTEHHILNLGVLPNRQKEGIGTMLLKSFLKDINMISSVFLEVKKSNFKAINLYKKSGFKILSERKNYYKDGSCALIMNFYKAI